MKLHGNNKGIKNNQELKTGKIIKTKYVGKKDMFNKWITSRTVALFLIIFGCVIIFYGVSQLIVGIIGFGISSIIIGLVVLTFTPQSVIEKDIYEKSIMPIMEFFDAFIKNTSLSGNAVYLPPYLNLPKGGTFIPLKKDFDINLAVYDEKTTIIKRGRESGLLISPPTGYYLYEKFYEYIDINKYEKANVAVSNISGVLKTFELVDGVEYMEEEDEIIVILENVKLKHCSDCSIDVCKKVGCPLCSSVLFSIAKVLNCPIYIKSMEKKDNHIKITITKMDDMDKYLWGD